MITYNPNVPRNEEQFCVSWKERHPLARTLLLLVLRVHPRSVFHRFDHTPERLRMVHKWLVESLCQRCIRDICGNVARSAKILEIGTRQSLSVCVLTIMCGSYAAACNHKIVLPDHAPARLNSSTYSSAQPMARKTVQTLTYISPSSSDITSTRFLQSPSL